MNEASGVVFDRGIFTLSLDFELIWGTLDLFGPEGFKSTCEIEREVIVEDLLKLLVEYEIPATWCVVGHLLLDRCDGKHPEIVRPRHSWFDRDWFTHDPASDASRDPVFYARDLIEKIRACPVPQEIGSHSFSHVIFGDEGCSRETARSEVAESVRVSQEMGIEMQSFVFPRNLVGHLDVLREHGFTCFRGPEPNWYERASMPSTVKRLAHLWDVLIAAQPPAVLPEKCAEGLWNIPGSMIYFPMHGLRRYIPMDLRVRRAHKGLKEAADTKRIFHLWFHPTNLADGIEEMFSGLRMIFERVVELRNRGELDVLPMGSVAEQLQMAESAR